MKKNYLVMLTALALWQGVILVTPIPIPLPAQMPLEEMEILIERGDSGCSFLPKVLTMTRQFISHPYIIAKRMLT